MNKQNKDKKTKQQIVTLVIPPQIEDRMRVFANFLIDRMIEESRKKGLSTPGKSDKI